jgi:DNA repair protein RadA/Sms
LAEFDRVLAGGVVPGSVTLLAGEPGIGKSTLSLQAAMAMAGRGARTLVVAAEESAAQVRSRAARLGELPADCFLLPTDDLRSCLDVAEELRPALLVVDSVQALQDGSLATAAGSPNQVRETSQALASFAKASATSTLLVGHVTKEGALAGPRALEHLVDTVLSFEGDRHHALRSLVCLKHRFGPAGELGLFEMGETGLSSIDDPSAVLLADRRPGRPGSVAAPVIEGRRPLLVEMQALVTRQQGGAPRRVARGIASQRVSLLLAVLEQCCAMPVGAADVFVSTLGGIKVVEPAADLPLCLAVASSLAGAPIEDDTAVFGEVGLTGDLRQVTAPQRRLLEAERLGFRRVIAPPGTPEGPPGLALEPAATLEEVLALVFPGVLFSRGGCRSLAQVADDSAG